MAHKALVGGAGYDVIGGKPLVGGAGYAIAKGRTLIGGAGYDLPFKQPTFDEIMADMQILAVQGRNSTRTETVVVPATVTEDTTFYVLQFISGYMAIAKVDAQYVDANTAPIVTSEILKANAANRIPAIEGAMIYGTDPSIIVSPSYDGTMSDQIYAYGATVAIVRFPSYVPTQIDAAIRAITLTRLAGRNDSANGTVYSAYNAAGRWFVAFNTDNGFGAHIAYSSPLGTVIYSTDTTNPSLLWQSGTNMYISQNGTSSYSSHGGSIVSVSG